MVIENYLNYKPKLAASSWVHKSAVVIGEVVLGENVSVWPSAVLRGDVGKLTIGDNSNIQDGAVIHATNISPYNDIAYPTTIGDNVTVGHNAILHGCEIANNVLIGMGATVLDGAVIASNCIIGANSLVPTHKKLDSGYLYIGSPVKKLRKLTQSEFDFLKYSADHYIELKNNQKE